MASPKQTFENNIRPAELLLHVYRLLDTNDQFTTDTLLVESLRDLVKAGKEEDLLVVYNELFLGLIRESAHVTRSTLRRSTLNNLLRQAVVVSCTALDTYLPTLLKTNLPLVIRAVGRDFVPRGDQGVSEYLSSLTFTLDDILRQIDDPNPAQFLSDRILGLANFSYLSSKKGVHVTGRLLGIQKPWDEISDRLQREKRDLTSSLDSAVNRRNDIVHRADHSQDAPDGDQQEISLAWTHQAVETIRTICLALDELVGAKMKEYQESLNA